MILVYDQLDVTHRHADTKTGITTISPTMRTIHFYEMYKKEKEKEIQADENLNIILETATYKKMQSI